MSEIRYACLEITINEVYVSYLHEFKGHAEPFELPSGQDLSLGNSGSGTRFNDSTLYR